MDMCEGDSEKCEGKLKEKIAMLLVQIDREWDLKIKEIKKREKKRRSKET